MNNPFVFFGTSSFSVIILERLKEKGIVPSLIVTTPDQPKGRKLIMTPPPVKEWADKEKVSVIQPERLRDEIVASTLSNGNFTFFLTASYGKIIPQSILSIPPKGCLNIHPSLLPKYRGPSPIQYQLLANEERVGTSIMLMDSEVDHGPILAQKEISLERTEGELTLDYLALEKKLAEESATLFAETLPQYLKETILPRTQDHAKATFTKMIEKKDGELNLADNARENYRKYLAYFNWPGTYFFVKHEDKEMRVLIKKASFKNGVYVIERVLPEGKTERDYSENLF